MIVLWLALAGFLVGGAIAMRQQGRSMGLVVLLGVAGLLSALMGVLSA
jgi:hypothetical protein